MSMVEEFGHTKEEHFGALIFRAILVDMKLYCTPKLCSQREIHD